MARRDKVYPLSDFSDGVDYDSAPFTVGKKSLIDASNIIPSTSVGAIAQRNGIAKFNVTAITESSIAKAVVGLFSFMIGAVEYFVCQAGTKFKNNTPEGTWSDITGSVALTDSMNNLTSFDILAQTLWFRNRIDGGLYYWPGSGNIAQVPSGQLYLVTIVSSGNGAYVVGDVLTITGGGGTGGTITITGVNAGTINAVSITTPGSGYTPTASAATSGGTGNGATVWIQQISTPPSATIAIMFDQHLWSFGDLDTPLIGTFSDISVGNLHDSANNTLSFDDGQGQIVTGAVRWGVGNMLVFKDRSISLVQATGTYPSFTKSLYADGIGCVSHQSIVTLPGGAVMWWDYNDIYIIQGNVISSATNHPITGKPRLRNFFRNKVNPSRLKYVVGTYYPDLDIVRWHYAGIGSSFNNLCLDYHIKTQSFWPGTVRGTSICTRTLINTGTQAIYSGDTDGYVRKGDTGTNDDGAPISSNARLPWQAFEGVSLQKKFSTLQAFLELTGSYSIYADFYFDQGSTPSVSNVPLTSSVLPTTPVFDTADWDVDSFPVESTLFETSGAVNRLFKTVSVNLHNTGTDQPYTIDGVCFFERPLEATVKA